MRQLAKSGLRAAFFCPLAGNALSPRRKESIVPPEPRLGRRSDAVSGLRHGKRCQILPRLRHDAACISSAAKAMLTLRAVLSRFGKVLHTLRRCVRQRAKAGLGALPFRFSCRTGIALFRSERKRAAGLERQRHRRRESERGATPTAQTLAHTQVRAGHLPARRHRCRPRPLGADRLGRVQLAEAEKHRRYQRARATD